MSVPTLKVNFKMHKGVTNAFSFATCQVFYLSSTRRERIFHADSSKIFLSCVILSASDLRWVRESHALDVHVHHFEVSCSWLAISQECLAGYQAIFRDPSLYVICIFSFNEYGTKCDHKNFCCWCGSWEVEWVSSKLTWSNCSVNNQTQKSIRQNRCWSCASL
jgi:hypothetical protein